MSYKPEPIEMMLEGAKWVAIEPQPDFSPDAGMPWVTHQGEMDFFGLTLRCFRLSDGRAVIHADDMNKVFALLSQ